MPETAGDDWWRHGRPNPDNDNADDGLEDDLDNGRQHADIDNTDIDNTDIDNADADIDADNPDSDDPDADAAASCPHCGAQVFDEDVLFCPRCGEECSHERTRGQSAGTRLPTWVIVTAILCLIATVWTCLRF